MSFIGPGIHSLELALLSTNAMEHYLFESAIVLEVSGPDSTRYMNARLSNDIHALSEETLTVAASGQAIQAAALTAQGKTQGFFTVMRRDDSYLMYCAAGDVDDVLASFKQFIVADQVTVTRREDLKLLYTSKTPVEAQELLGADFLNAAVIEDIFYVRSRRAHAAGCDILLKKDRLEEYLAILVSSSSIQLTDIEFNLQRICSGMPSFPTELNEDLLFAEAELSHAVSFSKGCYVGQESLEMLAARGKLPARIVRLDCQTQKEDPSGITLFAESDLKTRVGKVLSAAFDSQAGSWHCLARVKASVTDGAKLYITSDSEAQVKLRTSP